MIRLTIPGEVVPQGRPIFSSLNNTARDPDPCRDYKTHVAWTAKNAVKEVKMHEKMDG